MKFSIIKFALQRHRITNLIVNSIDGGAGSWEKPWNGLFSGVKVLGIPVNIATGKSYQGQNAVTLWGQKAINDFSCNVWGTSRQWRSQGYRVIQNSIPSIICYRIVFNRPESDNVRTNGAKDGDQDQIFSFVKRHCVFNGDQIDGFRAPPGPEKDGLEEIYAVDRFITNCRARLIHKGVEAHITHIHPTR